MADRSALRRITGTLRDHAPQQVLNILRRVVQSWGMLTARWRMRPAFLVVGAQRAGTTTLYRVLSQHPQVVRPTARKGVGYFDDHYHRGARWYTGHFPIRCLARLSHGRRAQTFESGGYYLFHPLAAERIARDLPDVKIIVMVREPVERSYSAYKHEFARGFETETFERALELEDERLEGEEDRIRRDPTYASFHHRHHAYRSRSRYSVQIDRFQELVGPERVHVADADEFFADPVAEFARVQAFLGLDTWTPHDVSTWNARPGSPLDPDLRQRLSDDFAPFDARLAEQMGRTPRWRRTRPGPP